MSGEQFASTRSTALCLSGLLALCSSFAPVGPRFLIAAGCDAQRLGRSDAPPKAQPIPFSHRVHCDLGLKCSDCHEIPAPGWTASYPEAGKCMQCHEAIKTESPATKKLATYFKEQKPVPWVQIYKLPGFVGFSHQVHVKKAALACEVCHGPVAERDVLTKEKSISMATCQECHATMDVRTSCVNCH